MWWEKKRVDRPNEPAPSYGRGMKILVVLAAITLVILHIGVWRLLSSRYSAKSVTEVEYHNGKVKTVQTYPEPDTTNRPATSVAKLWAKCDVVDVVYTWVNGRYILFICQQT